MIKIEHLSFRITTASSRPVSQCSMLIESNAFNQNQLNNINRRHHHHWFHDHHRRMVANATDVGSNAVLFCLSSHSYERRIDIISLVHATHPQQCPRLHYAERARHPIDALSISFIIAECPALHLHMFVAPPTRQRRANTHFVCFFFIYFCFSCSSTARRTRSHCTSFFNLVKFILIRVVCITRFFFYYFTFCLPDAPVHRTYSIHNNTYNELNELRVKRNDCMNESGMNWMCKCDIYLYVLTVVQPLSP